MRIRLGRDIKMFWCLMALLLLAACAPAGGRTTQSAQTGQPGPTPSSQASPTITATPVSTPGNQARNGCSTAQPPADAQKQADVVITQTGIESAQPVTLNKGQTLEVRLLATVRWHLHMQNSSALNAREATGWYNATLKDCLWRFTAVATGTATLSFTGTVICDPKGQCPVAALVQQYTITVR